MVGLYLVQHGKAFDEKVDPERRLTPEGVAETERIAKYLNSIGIIVAEIIIAVRLGLGRRRRSSLSTLVLIMLGRLMV